MINFWLRILLWPVCYFGGGGGGGAGNQQLDFQKQQIAQQQTLKDQINRIFGYGGVDVPGAPTRAAFTKPVVTSSPRRDYGVPGSGVSYRANQSTGPIFDQSGYDAAVAARNAALATNVGVAKTKADREALYTKVGQDIFNQKAQQLDEQQKIASREVGFQLARQGTYGGSSQVDQEAQIQRDRDLALTQIGGQAEGGSAALRSSDEQARLNLLSRVDAGLDQSSAVTSAINQITNAKDAILSSAQAQNLGDVFNNIALLNTAGQTGAAQGRGLGRANQYNQLFGAPTPGTGGYGGSNVSGRVTP